MCRTSRRTRPASRFTVPGLCLLVLTASSPHVARAERVSQSVANSLADWSHGTFDGTVLGRLRSDLAPGRPPGFLDQAGAVQFTPIGLVTPCTISSVALPEVLSDNGATAIGNHLFV